jgi:hypothetical protein
LSTPPAKFKIGDTVIHPQAKLMGAVLTVGWNEEEGIHMYVFEKKFKTDEIKQ